MKQCTVCKGEIIEKETGICKCSCGYTEISARENKKPNEIDVPLSWEELDQIIIALRLTNKAFKGNMRDKLEIKMSDYSRKEY